uniref:DNA-directed RNA polymerase subunit beta' n=1 Tax=Eubacterium cellulosolvens TaxID=29322 RepID=UPI000483E926|nr:DNA-directed RNA polymerase subunit beta' [[Eubacterium] cellulosolvens]
MPETVKKEETNQQLNFDAIKIGLASPDKIREWSYGEVKKPETINYRTLKPEKDGLFCERIFGPTKDWECHCGKYKKIRYKGVVCDRCGVEVTKSSVRRERMGHIELAAPVSHIWYFKGIPSRMGLILDLSPRTLERVLYFASYIVLDPGQTTLTKKQVLNEAQYQEYVKEFGYDSFRVGMGAEAVKELLSEIDLEKEYNELSEELDSSTGQKRARIIKRLEVVEAFLDSGNNPEWMILDCIPVIPPDLRPMVQLDGGRFATSDLNDLYRRIINRNNRLKRLLDLGAPDIIVRNEKRMLQEAVDALIDNGRRGRPVTGPGNRALKSLSDMLKGKSGRFRQNLLGKRVDYSGRSVIVNGPQLKIFQCGLPKEMAIELFKPFVMKELVAKQLAHNIKNAKKMVEKLDPQVWDVLEDVIKQHPVMLNRAPTLHRLGIQAFEPILVEGKAIKLHPLVCTAFNADFDGDQMAVHLPLTEEAQAECRFMLLSPNNLLKPSDGGVVAVPSQDMVLGIYYLTQERPGAVGEGTFYKDLDEAVLAYENRYITLQSRIKVRRTGKDQEGNDITQVVESTLGRLLFNEMIPQDLGYVDRTIPGNELVPEIDTIVKKGNLKKLLQKIMDTHGATLTAEVMDNIKNTGYHISTIAGMTVSISDMTVPAEKPEILAEAERTVEKITRNYKRGLITDEERYKEVVSTWQEADDTLTKDLLGGLDKYNNIFMMADSGARGSDKQIKQLAGMRGLMQDTTGHTIELPIKSNFREGLDVLEYFMSAHGARKGLSDTALRTADSGYLTRRMVDVSQNLMIRMPDCSVGRKEIPGMWVESFTQGKEMVESLEERITGRFSCYEIKDKDGNVIVKANHMITPRRAAKIVSVGVDEKGEPITKVKIRTILTCRSKLGICSKCYGANMATGEVVQVGEAVGTIAAQSIGEPGTQLTMRNFHTGGVAGTNDITAGLPRVEELFEARKPKGLAIITEIKGTAQMMDTKKKREIVVTNNESGESKTYLIPYGTRLKKGLEDNGATMEVEAGDPLTEGSINPHDLLRIKGTDAVQDYLLGEVQRVYRLQGVDICDKHVEVIVRQMLKKVRIEDGGDTGFMPGRMMDYLEVVEANEKMEEEGKEIASFERMLLGITKASLATDSFLSAASFQETTRVLTDAAIKGKVDHLIGLKENVIIGKLIPAGTGMKYYRNLKLDTDEQIEAAKAAKAAAEAAEAEAEAEEQIQVESEEVFETADAIEEEVFVDDAAEAVEEELNVDFSEE